MTLIAAMMNAKYAVQVSDRALSTSGQPLPRTLTKGSVLICDDARLIVGFTGLASVGSFETMPWMLATLTALAPPTHLAEDICKKFVDTATAFYRRDRRLAALPPRGSVARRSCSRGSGPCPRARYQPVSLLVTNFQNWNRGSDDPEAWPEFKPLFFSPRADVDWNTFNYVERIGAWLALGEPELADVRELVRQRRPSVAVVRKTVEVVRAAADHPSCRGSVGEDLLSIVLPADAKSLPTSEYHPAAAAPVLHFPNIIDARRMGGIAIRDISLKVSPGGTPLAVPRVVRNQPCPCRSGKKFKFCHGR
jgi:hypothetical protein